MRAPNVRRVGLYADGREKWGAWITDPRNGKRKLVIGESANEVHHSIGEIRRLARQARDGLVSQEELAQRVEAAACGPLQVEEAWNLYAKTLDADWAPKARAYWKLHLREKFRGKACAELTKGVMEDWHEWFRRRKIKRRSGWEPYSPRTIRNVFDLLHAALNLAIENKRLGSIPWGSWAPPKGKRKEREACRSPEELARLAAAAAHRDDRSRQRWKIGDLLYRILVGATLGNRQGELSGMGWDDFAGLDSADVAWLSRPWLAASPSAAARDPELPPVYYTFRHQARDGWRKAHPDWQRPKDPPKHRSHDDDDPPERVQVHPVAVWALLQQREQLRRVGWYRPDGPVFPEYRRGGWRSHADSIDPEEFRDLWRAAGLPNPENAVPHSLRHTMVTLTVAQIVRTSGDLRQAQALSRHKDLKTLDPYIHGTGRGIPAPALGPVALPRRLLDGALEVVAIHGAPDHDDPWGLAPRPGAELERAEGARRRDERERKRQAYLGRDPADLARWFKAWHAAGRPGDAPREVKAAADQAYRRAYQAKLRGCSREGPMSAVEREACQAAGQKAKRGTLRAWERFVREADEALLDRRERDRRRFRAAAAKKLRERKRPPLPPRAKPVAKRYGDAEVGERTGTRGGRALYACSCSCGVKFEAAGADLRAGRVTSCGHARGERGAAVLRAVAKTRGRKPRAKGEARDQQRARRAQRREA